METMYQRSKIQEESMHYEWLKHTGEYPIIGVNTFLGKDGSPTVLPGEVIRSTEEEKQQQIENLQNFQKSNEDKTQEWLNKLQLAAINQQNLFEVMMEAVKYCWCRVNGEAHCICLVDDLYVIDTTLMSSVREIHRRPDITNLRQYAGLDESGLVYAIANSIPVATN
jgi:hypothetical protein